MKLSMDTQIAQLYLDEARHNFHQYKRLAEKAFAQLQPEHWFLCLDSEANSIAQIVKHIAGNMRSRFTDFLTSDGEKPDRNRDQEFVMEPGIAPEQVLAWWETGWNCVFRALDTLTPPDLARIIFIRGQEHTVLAAINRQLLHYAHHIGQIVFLAKHLRGTEWKTLSIPRGQSALAGTKAEKEFGQRDVKL